MQATKIFSPLFYHIIIKWIYKKTKSENISNVMAKIRKQCLLLERMKLKRNYAPKK